MSRECALKFNQLKIFSENYKRQKSLLMACLPTPQNGQTHSDNSSATAVEFFWVCLTFFVGLGLEGLSLFLTFSFLVSIKRSFILKQTRS